MALASGIVGAGPAAAAAWSPAASMVNARSHHTATLLRGGNVLVAGGRASSLYGTGSRNDAELYNPSANAWSDAGSFAGTPREQHTATLFSSGDVLVAGGVNSYAWAKGVGGFFPLASAEFYSPVTNKWTAAASLATARYAHTATRLRNDNVLVAGGRGDATTASSLASAEIFQSGANQWTAAASLATARYAHTATLLPDGRVLVVGGRGGATSSALASAELYDADTDTWTAAAPLATARYEHTATLLPNGKVLVAGGIASDQRTVIAAAELYDPAANAWVAAGALELARSGHSATALLNGNVLVAGGNGTASTDPAVSPGIARAELYDPTFNTWLGTDSLRQTRAYHTATLLNDGKVLVAGGSNSSAELYASADSTAALMATIGSRGTVMQGRPMYGGFELVSSAIVHIAVRGPSLKTLGITPTPLNLPYLSVFGSAVIPAGGASFSGCNAANAPQAAVANYYANARHLPLDPLDTCISMSLPAGVYTFSITPTPNDAASLAGGEVLFEVTFNP